MQKCNFCNKKCTHPYRRGLGNRCRDFLKGIDKGIGTHLEEHYKNFGQSRRGRKFKGIKYPCCVKGCQQDSQLQGYCRTHHRKFTDYEKWYYTKRKPCSKCGKRPKFARDICHACYQSARKAGRIEEYKLEKFTYILPEKTRQRLLCYIDALEVHRKKYLTYQEWNEYIMPEKPFKIAGRIYARLRKIIGDQDIGGLKLLAKKKVLYKNLKRQRANVITGSITG